jgi:hypothetical protein
MYKNIIHATGFYKVSFEFESREVYCTCRNNSTKTKVNKEIINLKKTKFLDQFNATGKTIINQNIVYVIFLVRNNKRILLLRPK